MSITAELIERCLAGRCDDAERERVHAYLAAHPGVARYYRSLRAALGGETAQVVGRGDAERAYEALMQRMRAEIEAPAAVPTPRAVQLPGGWSRQYSATMLTRSRVARYVGAAGLVALVAVLAIWRGGMLRGSHRLATVPTTYVTPNGQRANIMLPDGSTVMLNVASRLEVPADFAAGDRTVRLRGEALFSVAHHTGAPFTVVAGRTATRVLGTAFVVRHYASDTISTIAVRTGKVAVGPVVLTERLQAKIGRDGKVHVQRADPAQFAFANGVLILDGVPLRDAIVELDRWYDADIRLGDPALGKNLMQGTFAAGSLADLAQILGFTFHTRVVREGRVITLYPR